LAIVEAMVEVGADVAGQAGDFTGSAHVFLPFCG
jgi:hypothetical protein